MRAVKLTGKGYAAAVAALCLLVFLRALTCDFINWDDPLYVIENTGIRILDWQFIKESFTVSYLGWWMPLTWISFAIDYRIWGLNPSGYHLTNLLLHAANAGLVVLVADLLLRQCAEDDGKPEQTWRVAAFLTGILWGLHPLRVESVAWVTERKDVLNGFFALLTILFHLSYLHRKKHDEHGSAVWFYVCSLSAFLISLTAKPVSVVIPAMLLVMDWYPLRRMKRGGIAGCLKEKIPYAIIAAAMVLATLYLASGESILVSFTDFPLSRRLILAGNSIFEYLKMTVYPVGLVNMYLLPRTYPLSYYFGAAATVALMAGCAAVWRNRPWFLSVMLLFVLPLLPVLGLFQNGAQAYADRFTYLPSLATSMAAAVLIVVAYRKVSDARGRNAGILCALLAAAIPVSHSLISIRLIGAWKNAETLWTRVIEIKPIGRAYYLRAEYLMRNGRYQEAAQDLAQSIRMGRSAGFPGIPGLHAIRGDALAKTGRYAEAVTEFSESLRMRPQANIYYHRGAALEKLGKMDEAQNDFRIAGEDRKPVDLYQLE